ncbi:MAG: tetratricopeptide repeat protein [Phycisphaerales bacterium]|nr:tetratricopeptide repeat protein [Phycisphaerales bacterium]
MSSTHRQPMAIAAIAGVLVMSTGFGLVGCSSSGTRDGSSSEATNEINPSIAFARRQRAEALEHYQKASALHLDDKFDDALSEYRLALELDDKLYAAWNNMGQLLMAEGNYHDAVSAFQIASGIETTDPRPEYNIGIAYQKVGWANDSYTHFKNAIERDPNYVPALRGLIRSAEMLGMGDPQIMDYIRNAQLRETDEQWVAYLSTQYYRVCRR